MYVCQGRTNLILSDLPNLMAYHDKCPQKTKKAMSPWPSGGDNEVAAMRWI